MYTGAPPLCWGRPESRFSIGNIAPAQGVERQKDASYSITKGRIEIIPLVILT